MADIDVKKLSLKVINKYKVNNNTFSTVVKDNPKDKIEVEIGDSKQPDFKPQFKLMRWDNEVNFSLRSQEDATATIEIDKETIKYKAKDYELHLYDKPEASEDGGYEVEFVLPSKPKSNIITSTIETKGFNFYKQLALTQKEIDQGANRPENVVDSIAAYYKDCPDNYVDGKLYRNGKAFHIFRVKAIDANSKECWCDQDIVDNLHKITIPQKFLDEAVYPVIVDPTFGYTTVGSSTTTGLSIDRIQGRRYTVGVNGGTLDSASVCAIRGSADSVIKFALVDNTDDSILDETDSVAISSGYTWNTADFIGGYTISASTAYVIGFWGGSYFSTIKYDDTSVPRLYCDYPNYYGDWPDPVPWEDEWPNNLTFSAYITYTTAGSSSIKKLCGVAQASLKKVAGVVIASINKIAGVSN